MLCSNSASFPPVPPRITPFYFEDNPLHAGQYAQVNCLVAEGDLPVEIQWTLNGRSLRDFGEVSYINGKRSSMLTIESVSYETSGNYTCTAKNRAGEVRYMTSLQVNG